MGELLIKPYEISVWEDRLTQIEGSEPAEYKFEEQKLAVIGSNNMEGPSKIYEPIFNKKSNGEKSLTFSLKYKYFDPYSGNEEVINPFAALLSNERKIKLNYDGQWYEFIIKEHSESTEDYTWTYTCTDAFVLELSKNGYNITFDAELNNNQGTAYELVKETLKDTDWKVGDIAVGKQLIEEPLYRATLLSTSDIEIINASNNGEIIPTAPIDIYLFYSYVKNQNGKFIQFIIRDDTRDYVVDDKNVINDTNFRILTNLTFKDNYFENEEGTKIISIGPIENVFQGYRLAYKQLTTYDPITEHTVDKFKIYKDNEPTDLEVYKYIDYTYTTSNVIMNFFTNGENFNALEDGSLQGWNPYVDFNAASDNDKIDKLELVTRPELGTGKGLVNINTLSQIEGFLKAKFKGPLTNYKNAIYNSGIENNAATIKSISQGEKFLFRWRAGTGSLSNLVPTNKLRVLVAKYTQDTPNPYSYYYKHIDSDNIILQFEGTPQVFNNIIKDGYLEDKYELTTDTEIVAGKTYYIKNDSEIEEYIIVVNPTVDNISTYYEIKHNYLIDNVVQTPSTKYIYKDKNTTKNYIWNGLDGNFEEYIEGTTNFLPYYYLVASAQKSITNTELLDPEQEKNIGIFVYTIDSNEKEYYIQDIQLTRYVEDANGEPILIGNIPTATSTPTEYYYFKPLDKITADEVETYTTVEELLANFEGNYSLVPIYNEESEKILSISETHSNCFNILQSIAETFECWVDLVVEHDEKGQIVYDSNGISQKFVYLREYAGKDNYSGFKYGVNLQSIERTVNSDEIVTKLIVEQTQSEYVEDGVISIANSSSNPSGESYIYNFNYYYNQGMLDREATETEVNSFFEQVKEINLQLKTKQKESIDLEASLTRLKSDRNVYTELIDTAEDNKTQALADFWDLTGQTYEEYRKIHTTLNDDDQLTEEETILDTLGELYTNSAVINNYSGLLTNIDTEYKYIREKLKGSENYKLKIWVEIDSLKQRHIIIELNDFLENVGFTIGSYTEYSTVSRKRFDVESFDAQEITFTAPTNYYFKTADNSKPTTLNYQINDNKIGKLQIICDDTKIGIEDEIQDLLDDKTEIVNNFNNKYYRFIQEGTWSSTEYIDSELYYLDALQVSNTSAYPIVSYTIDVVEISQLEGFEWYKFDTGDKSYIEDTEFFGWSNKNGNLTPAREEVIVSEVEWHLDEPDKNTITVQNYKTRFEDLFQRISATIQTVQYNEATYAKISSLLDANGTINQNVLLESLNNISGKNYNLTSDGSVLIDGDQISIRNLTNPTNLVKINSEGIRISSDGGVNWTTAISGRGIDAGAVYTGSLNTNQIVIGSDKNPSFRWDKSGISAYKLNNGDSTYVRCGEHEIFIQPATTYYTYNTQTNTFEEVLNPTGSPFGQNYYRLENPYNLKTFVRYDQYGLYGIKNNEYFTAQSLQDIKDKAHFAVTWDGFFIKNSYEGGGRVEITSDNDFRVLNTIHQQEQEKIKIGALEWTDSQGNIYTDPANLPDGIGGPSLYGIRIKNDSGAEVMKTDDDGNITITGTINASAGEIGGMTVDSNQLTMNHIILQPGVGIYSDYSNPTPFIISDTDGTATFNQINARGHIEAQTGTLGQLSVIDTITVGDSSHAGLIKSNGYVAGSSGWIIKSDGTAEFQNAIVRGQIDAGSGNFYGNVTVGQDLSDNTKPYIVIDGVHSLIQSSNYQDGAGYGWMINKDGDAVFNNITARGAIRTAVFEYAEIQAVGGIFIFRPSSTIREAVIAPNGVDLIVTVEKPYLFEVGAWCKISNYIDDGADPDVRVNNILLTNGLTHVYRVSAANGKIITLADAASMVSGIDAVVDIDSLIGGALIDMGNKANGNGEVGTKNYGIGVNSSDNTVNLPARAITLFETIIDETRSPKVSYKYRGILGTLPVLQYTGVNAQVSNLYHNNLENTQGIYTDNMYIGDNAHYIAFYTDKNDNNTKKLRIAGADIVFTYDDGQGGTTEKTLDDRIEEIEAGTGEDAAVLVIDSSEGNIFRDNQGTTDLTVTIFYGATVITTYAQLTNTFGIGAYLEWEFKDNTSNWVTLLVSDPRISNNGFTLTVNADSVYSKANFRCKLVI